MGLDSARVSDDLNMDNYNLRFTSTLSMTSSDPTETFFVNLMKDLEERFSDSKLDQVSPTSFTVDSILIKLHPDAHARKQSSNHSNQKDLLISWKYDDEELGSRVLKFLKPPTEKAKDKFR